MTYNRKCFCVIRKYKHDDQISVIDIINEATMETVWQFFTGALLSEVFLQMSVMLMGVCFIVFGIPFMYCPLTIPVTIAILYVIIYSAHMYKAMELNEDVRTIDYCYMRSPDTGFWVAEVYASVESTPLENFMTKEDPIRCEFISVEQLDSFAENLHGLKKTVVGTVAITKSNDSANSGWLRRMAVKSEYRRRGIASKLLDTALDFCSKHEYEDVELVTTECHYKARELYYKKGFEPSKTYYKTYMNVKQPMYKFVIPLKSGNKKCN